MAIEKLTRLRVTATYAGNIEVYTNDYGLVIEQGEVRLTFGKSAVPDLLEAIQAVAGTLPDGLDEVPF